MSFWEKTRRVLAIPFRVNYGSTKSFFLMIGGMSAYFSQYLPKMAFADWVEQFVGIAKVQFILSMMPQFTAIYYSITKNWGSHFKIKGAKVKVLEERARLMDLFEEMGMQYPVDEPSFPNLHLSRAPLFNPITNTLSIFSVLVFVLFNTENNFSKQLPDSMPLSILMALDFLFIVIHIGTAHGMRFRLSFYEQEQERLSTINALLASLNLSQTEEIGALGQEVGTPRRRFRTTRSLSSIGSAPPTPSRLSYQNSAYNLSLAIEKESPNIQNWEVVNALSGKLKLFDRYFYPQIAIVIAKGNLKELKLRMKIARITQKNLNEYLRMSIEFNQTKMITHLLKKGADPNYVKKQGEVEEHLSRVAFYLRFNPPLFQFLLTYGMEWIGAQENSNPKNDYQKQTNAHILWVNEIYRDSQLLADNMDKAQIAYNEYKYSEAKELYESALNTLRVLTEQKEIELNKLLHQVPEAYLQDYRKRSDFCERQIKNCEIKLNGALPAPAADNANAPLLQKAKEEPKRKKWSWRFWQKGYQDVPASDGSDKKTAVEEVAIPVRIFGQDHYISDDSDQETATEEVEVVDRSDNEEFSDDEEGEKNGRRTSVGDLLFVDGQVGAPPGASVTGTPQKASNLSSSSRFG